MIFPSTAVQWTLNGQDVLTIQRPINYGMVWLFVALAIVSALIDYLMIFCWKGVAWKDKLTLFAVFIIMLFVIPVAYADHGAAILSRKDSTLTIIDGFDKTAIYPLQGVQNVQIGTDGYKCEQMIFVLAGGNVSLGGWADREGIYQAASEANLFLSSVQHSGPPPANPFQ